MHIPSIWKFWYFQISFVTIETGIKYFHRNSVSYLRERYNSYKINKNNRVMVEYIIQLYYIILYYIIFIYIYSILSS